MIDESTEFGARAARHLREERVAWLTTVTPGGAPVPAPVWFIWEEPDSILMYTPPSVQRLKNLAANPRVALNFAGDGGGGDIVVINGRAAVDESVGPAREVPAYMAKYDEDIGRIGMDPNRFS